MQRLPNCFLGGFMQSKAISYSRLLTLVSLRKVMVCLLVMFCLGLIQPRPVQAKSSNTPAVELIAPETIRAVLVQYFVLPDTLLTSEDERAVFISRAQREIPELLATEGFFSGKVVLRSITPDGVLELEVIPGQRTVVTEVQIEF